MSGFFNRTEAGKALAKALADRDFHDPVILALPRGGVPVGIELARELHAPMDLVMVRKVGAPRQPELAVAAVVNGDSPQIAINEAIAAHLGLSHDEIERMARPQLDEIQRRRAKYLKGRTPVAIEGRTAIVVDDGIATGATMRASLKAIRQRAPANLILAVPVAARDALNDIRKDVDEVVCLLEPRELLAIGAHYSEFGQTTDEEVMRLMDEAATFVRKTGRETE